ncbi:MAG: chromosome segregation protein SMC [Candidatus Marsarchaeota archaeon]|jgi:chromosome segregation protein|nr:chromosome segregation protein SMC [Candidatus Marsarchaeota archaeon]
MLYLDRITIHNFKSFKHASLNLSKGFNCIVGPNGSGKSNVCDALLFALGESSLKRMRVSSAKGLINSTAKSSKDDGVRRAYVTVSFTGDENLDVSRMIKSNNKIAYRINGKRATRQELLDVLKAHKAEINETNTIAQGEISKLLSLSPRERRGLIDVAAGVKEFDDKKESAMRELEKVDAKITESNIQLNERQAFLNELEKEKADAERYTELLTTSKRVAYTILKAREAQIGAEYEKAVEGHERAAGRQKDIEMQLKKLDDELSDATAYKEKLTKKLNESSIELATANKLIEEANSIIRIKESEKAHIQEALAKSKERVRQLKDESNQIKIQIEQNSKLAGTLKARLAESEQELQKIDIGAGEKELITKYSEKQKELEALESRLSSVNAEYVSCNLELSKHEEGLKDAKQRLGELHAEHDATAKELQALQSKIASAEERAVIARKELSSYNKKTDELRERMSVCDTEMINVRESLAMSGRGADKIASVLKSEMKKGFYGRASELCSYDSKYAVAVYAAGSSRLNYFVVDSVDAASQAVEIIKAKGLGRASFIPLKEINAQETGEINGMDPLISKVKFDAKYRKAFEYIFSNTYIVDKIRAGNGIGKRRMVTLDGDVVEQSGIVTGGKLGVQQLPAVLEAKLNKLASEKSALTIRMRENEVELEQRRRAAASFEIEAAEGQARSKFLQAEFLKLEGTVNALSKASSGMAERVEALSKSKGGFASRKIEIEKEKEELKAECSSLYAALNRSAGSKKPGHDGKQSADRLKGLREEVEGIKVRLGSIEKENEMRADRAKQIAKELKGEEASITASKAQITDADSAIADHGKKKLEIQESIKDRSSSSDSLLKELQEHDDKINGTAQQKGRMTGEMARLEKEMMEAESRRSQLQTRLSDIKAELLSYTEIEQVSFKDVQELETKQLECRHEMELLGNVNLKAPEAYAQRKKDVDEAARKLGILNREKDSIMTMVGEIESRRLNAFNETFAQVNENFKRLYSSIFDGSAYLYLDNPSEPFNAKLLFNIQTANRKHSEEELSGGQKSLIIFALLFAIQMRKPMSFYLYDEIDVALDKENSKKLSKLVKELSKNSQFVVISHNDPLITMADTAIGIVKQENQSRAVGIELTNIRQPVV